MTLISCEATVPAQYRYSSHMLFFFASSFLIQTIRRSIKGKKDGDKDPSAIQAAAFYAQYKVEVKAIVAIEVKALEEMTAEKKKKTTAAAASKPAASKTAAAAGASTEGTPKKKRTTRRSSNLTPEETEEMRQKLIKETAKLDIRRKAKIEKIQQLGGGGAAVPETATAPAKVLFYIIHNIISVFDRHHSVFTFLRSIYFNITNRFPFRSFPRFRVKS